MIRKVGFDTPRYLKVQVKAIQDRVALFDKLYLEFGGKLCYDYHASRVLPGFDVDTKVQMLRQLGDQVELILCVSAKDIHERKIRRDFGLAYDDQAFKDMNDLRERDLNVSAVVINRFKNELAAEKFRQKLQHRGLRVFVHYEIPNYPQDLDLVVSDHGYGKQEYVETEKPIIAVTAPGPGSGKFSFCMAQLYNDRHRRIHSGFAKFETFPIWNLPLKHPVNIAYEAATADIRDFNLIDPFHLEAYQKVAVNYNRDVEVFPVLKRILEKITGGPSFYHSPTDMGVNRAGMAIVEDEVTREAAKQEVIRRYFRYRCEYAMGFADKETVQRVELFIKDFQLTPEYRKVVEPARQAAEEAQRDKRGNEGIFCGAAIELKDGTIITGNNSPLFHAASSVVIHAIKHLAGIPEKIQLLPPYITNSIRSLKTEILKEKTVSLDLEETLIALSISATTNPAAQLAIENLKELERCEVHMTHIPTPGDEAGLRRLGVNLTSDPNFSSKNLFIS